MFSFLNPFKDKKLICRDVPRESSREDELGLYPQRTRRFPALSFEKIVSHYGSQIHGIIDNLPLSEAEIDRLVMPAIESVIKLMHLLPASECQHHSGIGGLLLHSLESARIAIRLAEKTLFDSNVPAQERYDNSKKWIIASALLLLVHDIGKISDIRVTDAQGCVWNPNEVALHEWIETSCAKNYFVDWKVDRIHKKHELRALRFIYREIFSDELIEYFCVGGTEQILNAIEEALLTNSGVLSEILVLSDSQSVTHDMARRKNLPSDMTYVSSPLTTPIVAAIQENIETGLWSVNDEQGKVLITPEGVFIQVLPQTGQEIRETAIRHGNQGIPASIDVQLQVLSQSGFIATTDTGDVAVSPVSVHGHEINCARFLMPERIFPKGLPQAIPVATSSSIREEKRSMQETALSSTATTGTNFTELLKRNLAPQRQDSKKSDSTKPVATESPITPGEFAEVLTSPLEKEQAKVFTQRLFTDALRQLQLGSGILISNREEKDNILSCSTFLIEKIAANHGISLATLEALYQSLQLSRQINFDANQHTLKVVP